MVDRITLTTSAAVVPMLGSDALPGGRPRGRVTSPQDEQPEFARIAAAMKITGLARNTLYALARDGRITIKKIGYRTSLVDLASVRAYIAAAPDA